MPSIFTRIIDGEIPGRFVWRDEACVAFLDVRPLNRGHVLVVPRAEVDHWVDLDAETASHLMVGLWPTGWPQPSRRRDWRPTGWG